MVRYPKKNSSKNPKSIEEASLTQSQGAKLDQSIQEQVNIPHDHQVEELQERLHHLEEKLKDIENNSAEVQKQDSTSQPTLIHKPLYKRPLNLKKTIIVSLAISLIVAIMVGSIWFVKSRLYVAKLIITLETNDFNLKDEFNVVELNKLLLLQKSSSFLEEIIKLHRTKLTLGQDGKSLEVDIYALSKKEVAQQAEIWQKSYQKRYVQSRMNSLNNLLKLIDRKKSLIYQQMEKIFQSMGSYKSSEKFFLVNKTSKEKLDDLTSLKALELEKTFSMLNQQSTVIDKDLILKSLSKESKFLLDINHLRLTDLEFKQFLVSKDFMDSYDQGLRSIKKNAANIINTQAAKEHLNQLQSALIIKRFFLSSRQEAMDAVLNKRYVMSVEKLTDRQKRYVSLRKEFDGLYFNLEKLILLQEKVNKLIDKGLVDEIKIIEPISVRKY